MLANPHAFLVYHNRQGPLTLNADKSHHLPSYLAYAFGEPCLITGTDELMWQVKAAQD